MVAASHRSDEGRELSYIARQAIYRARSKIWGYQILHRTRETSAETTRRTLVAMGVDVGLTRVGGRHRLLVPFDADALLARLPSTLGPQQLVLEVSAADAGEPAVSAALLKYVQRGYPLAIDVGPAPPPDSPVLAAAQMLRFDAQDLASIELRAYAARRHAAGQHLILAQVREQATLVAAAELGFALFQGPWLSQPEWVSGLHVAPERAAAMTLLAKLQDPTVSFAELSALIHRDPLLSYQLLRFVGSAAMARPVRVDSVQRALTLLGLRAVQQWASLILLARAQSRDEHAVLLAMTRARMGELLGTFMSKNPAAAFTVGLFSALDHLLGRPLAELVQALPLEPEVSRALLGGDGYLGDILQSILSYEDGVVSGRELGLTSAHVASAYVDAVEWAEAARYQLTSAL